MQATNHTKSAALIEARQMVRLVDQAIDQRDRAVLKASQAGASTREIGRFTGMNHMKIHRIIRDQEGF